MSTSITAAFVRQFESEVHFDYQRRGSKLRNMVRQRNGVQGSSTTFQKIGKGTPSQKARNASINPMSIDHTAKECTLEDWYAGDWVDQLDESKISHDERRVIARAGAYALGRKTDELIIDSLAATSTTPTSSGAGGLNLATVMTAMKALGDLDVFEEGHMWAIVGWTEWTDLLQITEFASADYIGNGNEMPMLKGTEARRWLGTIWMPHSGVEKLKSGSTAKSFWFHEDAVGHAIGDNVSTDITWHGDRAAFFVNNSMSQGACLIDDAGVMPITTTRA